MLAICGALDESHDPACGNAHGGSASRSDVRAGPTDGPEGPVPQLRGRARPVRPLGLHREGVAGGHPRDPARLSRGRSEKELSADDKRGLFFRVIAPIALRINELILEDRVRAKELTERLAEGQSVTPDDQAWLTKLAVKYKVLESTSERLDSDAFAELLMRVDTIPPSLSLAQAANESGWGTSRFATEGNSLFGQWTWGKELKPAEQRTAELGDYRVAAFDSTGQAAYSYALNLNTERAYRDFRLKRAALRRQGLRISGTVLAETLVNYSERGQAYVDDLKALIRNNRLDNADDAYLRHMAVIHIVPAVSEKPK